MGATEKLRELGLLGPRTLLAHSVWLEDRELDILAETGSAVSHNPVSNLKIGAGIAPVLGMLRRGIPVALGTDGSASNDNQNMFGPLRLAAILHRVVDPAYDRWPGAADALRMATLHGARAAGFGDQIGRIATGFKADFVLLDLGTTYYHPRNDLIQHVVFAEVGSSVRTVLVDGRVVLDEGRVTTVDEAALARALAEQRIAGAAADVFAQEPPPAGHPLYALGATRGVAGATSRTPLLILSPHVSGFIPSYDDKCTDLFAENLRRFLAGEPLLNLVDRGRGY
jgi:cytosine/adenosine deaminase-related metal-dependent hydrolase